MILHKQYRFFIGGPTLGIQECHFRPSELDLFAWEVGHRILRAWNYV